MQNQTKNTVFLLLGSNLGDRNSFLANAEIQLLVNDIIIVNKSSIYETAPWGVIDQQPYLNQVLEVTAYFTPLGLLETILAIETKLGRDRLEKWGSRTIDIDILYFNNEIINEAKLSIPHPLLEKRAFALIPLVEVAKDYIHPLLMKSNKELLDACTDDLKVEKFDPFLNINSRL